MSADIVIVPELGDEVWVAWQARQIAAIAPRGQSGTAGFRFNERILYAVLQAAFHETLDRWHTWEWDDSLGGVITIDRSTPYDHPYLGAVLNDAVTADSITQAHQDLLQRALARTETILRKA